MQRSAGLFAHLVIAVVIAGLARPAHGAPAMRSPLTSVASAALGSTDGARVAVLSIGLDAKSRTQLGLLEHAAEEAIVRANRFELLRLQDAYDPKAAKSRARGAEEAATLLKDGQKALDDLDNAKATDDFVKAIAALRETDLSTGFDAYVQAIVLKGGGHATGGENPAAKQEIDRAVSLNPRVELPAQFYSPDLVKYGEAQKRVAAAAKGTLTVRTDPPGASVWVDGQYRGVSPATITQLTSAKHAVAVTLSGYALTQAELSPGEELVKLKPAEFGPALDTVRESIAREPESLLRDQAAVGLGKKLGVDQVVVLVAKKSTTGDKLDITALRIEVRDGHNAGYRVSTIAMNNEDAVSPVLDAILLRDDPRDGRAPMTHFKTDGSTQTKRFIGFSLLGATLAFTIAGISAGVQAQGAAAEYKLTPQPLVTISQNLKARGQTFAVMADLSFLVALASAAVGGTLVVLNSNFHFGAGDDEPRKKPDDKKKKRPTDDDDERKKPDDDKKKRADEDADRKKTDEKKKRADEDAERQRRDDERKKADDDKRKRDDDKKRAADEERDAKAEKQAEKQRAEEQRREQEREREREKAEDERRRAEEERAKKKPLTKKEREEEKKREEEERKRAEEEEARKRKEDEEKRRKQEDEERRKREEEKKKLEKKPDDDDLRNY